ncbi:MAG: transporter substrate-binding domain-containing protein [Lachnospiraceae bacterium]|nr:transporter substrate-binding domain-containing protein [Lachnospiraceae bacterium]
MKTKKLQRLFLVSFGILLLAGVSGCAGVPASGSGQKQEGSASESADLLSEIRDRGKIVFAMEGQWAPWTYHDESGELVGYDTEVGKAIAEKLGVEAEFIEGEWDGLFAGLDGKRYDAVINGVEITEERAGKYDFTTPYAYIRTALVVKDDNTEITTFEDLSGKKTSNSLGSTYADLAAEYGASVQNVDTLSETIDMLLSGRADATLNAEVSFYDYLSEHPDAPIKIVALTDEASEVSIPLRKGEETTTLREAIDQAVGELSEDGTLKELSEKYFGSDISKGN